MHDQTTEARRGTIVFMYPDVASQTIAELEAGRAPRERLAGYHQLRTRGWNVSISDARWLARTARIRRHMARFCQLPSAGMLRDWRKADAIVIKDELSLVLTLLGRAMRKRVVYLDAMFRLPTSRLRRALIRWNIRLADRVVCFSSRQAEHWASELDIEETSFTPVIYGMDIDFYRPVDRNPDDPPFVLSVGRDPGRDFGTLVEALAGTGLQLKLVTLPYLVSDRVRQAKDVEILERLSYQELFDLYARATVVAVPLSDAHTYPSGIRAVLEAALLRVPIVATRTPVIEEYFTHGRELTLVAPRDPASLRQAILVAASDEQAAMVVAERARRRAVREFPVSLYADQLESIVVGVVHGGVTLGASTP
jgi:glycosyltransferase involved in cell wall biosynthesis